MEVEMQSKNVEEKVDQILEHAQREPDIEACFRYLESDAEIIALAEHAKHAGLKVVLTQGTFDLVHIGHARYVREAKNHGDLLIVGVDDDEKARERKGENRPVVPFVERREILCHLRYVDAVAMKKATDPKWHLIKLVDPDILIAVEGTYRGAEIVELQKICGKVVVLPRQAETSTSAKVRKLVLDGAETLTKTLMERIPGFIQGIYHELKGGA
jgi:D-glycero-beta-D-manno-heptose 1-phosphate adenylyltransferase